MPSDTKPQARDDLDEFCKDTWGVAKMSALPSDKKRSETFMKWYVTRIHNFIEAPFIDEELVDDCITDGANDLEADFVYRDTEERTVLIVQARWRKNASIESAKDIAYFAGVLDRLRDPTWIASANESVRQVAATIDWETDSFDLRYITLGRIDGAASIAASQATDKLKQLAPSVAISFLGENELNIKYRTSIAQHQPLPGPQELHVKDLVKVGESWLAVASGTAIKQLFQSGKRDQLFSENVRLHLGATKINKKIAETIEKSPEEFFYYNNGVSCLATSVSSQATNGTVLKLNGLQVINGAQTVRTIGEHASDANLQKVRVLIRITPRDMRPDNPDFATNIIRYNNTQNAIKEQDFIANDPVQIALKDQFSFPRFAKSVLYHPKRGPRRSSSHYNIEVVEYAQRIVAFLDEPTSYKGSIPYLMTPEHKPYRIVFGDGERVYHKMPDADFKLRSGIWWLSEEFNAQRLVDRKTPDFQGCLDSLSLLLFVARGLLERNYPSGYRELLMRLYKGEWRLSGTTPVERMFMRIYKLSRDLLREDFVAQKTAATVFKPSEWKRKEATIGRLRSIFTLRAGLDGVAESYPFSDL